MSLSTLDLLVGRLISLLVNEAASLGGVSDEIKEMQRHFKSMRSFLIEADKGRANSEVHKDWVSNVREIAFEVEDAIDEFTYHVNKQRQWRGNKCQSFFQRSLCFPAHLVERRQVATKLQGINKRMKRITKETHQLGVEQLEEISPRYDLNWRNRLSESSLFFKDDDLVGIDMAQNQLLGWLMGEERRPAVIKVVGMGGLGKTTLVANTFNKQSVQQHFEFSCWLTVSKEAVIEELLKSMVKEVYKQTNGEVPMKVDTMSYKVLAKTLVNYLRGRRYLIVLDDVWDYEFWQEISILLPEGSNGSRVMVTTRKEDVVPSQLYGFESYVQHIKPLGEGEAWKLFCRRTFPNNPDWSCPPYLDSLARTLAAKCEGLPLAIVVLGSLMSSKKSIAEWKRVLDNLNWELSNNPALGRVKTISLLSYDDLPFQLKHCFLYCCGFPENFVIYRKRLIRLWMAEGLLEKINDVAPESVAEDYLMKLIDRNLLKVVERNPSGRPKGFRMHAIWRELALSISGGEKFIAISDGQKGLQGNELRRCSIAVKNKEIILGNGMSRLRSLLIFFVADGEISKSSFKLPSDFKLLRVLDLEEAPIDELPRNFGNLFNLRYLNLNRTDMKVLPKSVGKLFNLQTLLLKYTKIQELPGEIVKLQNLRHLIASYYEYDEVEPVIVTFRFIRVPSNICMIKSLQVLGEVQATETLVKQLKVMTQLTTLSLDSVEEASEDDLCLAIEKMEHLHHLELGCGDDATLKLDGLGRAPRFLEKLELHGKLDKIPHWFSTLVNLTHLVLDLSGLKADTLSHVQDLPNLSYLRLWENAFLGERLCFVKGFPKLRFLWLMRCSELKEIVMEEGAMPALQELKISKCKGLMRLPDGAQRLSHLKEVRLYDVSDEVVESICGKGNTTELPSTPHILLYTTKTLSPDEAVQAHHWSSWAFRILN